MEHCRAVAVVVFCVTLLTSALARPHGSASQELLDIATGLTHSLNELVDLMAQDRPARRRRFVQYHIARSHHLPDSFPRTQYEGGRRRRNRYNQNGGARNADISDH